MTVAGNVRTNCSSSTPQLARNVAGTYDYGYVATGTTTTPGAIIFRRPVGGGATQTFDLATITGNPFNMPLGVDAHFTIQVMPDADELLHVQGNTHAGTFQYGYTTWPPNTSSTWTFPAFASLPYVTTGANIHTYATWVRASDGTIYALTEQEENAGYERRLWTLAKLPAHSTTWQFVNPSSPIMLAGNHPALSTEPDRCYCIMSLVGTRLHYFGMFARIDEGSSLWWRRGLHYLRSDPPYDTWKTISGTTVTLPITWATYNTYTDCAVSSAPALHMTWGQAFAVDPATGNPHFVIENTQSDGNPGVPACREVWWTGSAWTARDVASPGTSIWPGIFAANGYLWTLTAVFGRSRIREVAGGGSLYISGATPNGICTVPDPIGVRDQNRITLLCADGDTPAVYDFPIRTQTRAG